MEKCEGSLNEHTKFQEGLALFRKVLEAHPKSRANQFYQRLKTSKNMENITFRTSTALGDGVEGLTQMYVLIGGQKDVDMDELKFDGVTKTTPRTLRITHAEVFPNKYPPAKMTATLLHEFMVHGVPFQTLFDSINTATTAEEMAAFWRKSRQTDNSGYTQHSLYGAGKTEGLDEVVQALKNSKTTGISKNDAAAILDELEKDIAFHKKSYPL